MGYNYSVILLIFEKDIKQFYEAVEFMDSAESTKGKIRVVEMNDQKDNKKHALVSIGVKYNHVDDIFYLGQWFGVKKKGNAEKLEYNGNNQT